MNNQFLNQKTPNEIAKSLADRIKKHRKKLKISQEFFAQKSGVSLGSIKSFEFGNRNTNIHSLQKIANYHDIELLYRLMCFNVFAHNRDDYSKNFSILYDESKKEWHFFVLRCSMCISLRVRH